jgi:hypothetical protein
MQQQLSETGTHLDCIARSGICADPPWPLRSATVIDSSHQLGNKIEIAPDLFTSKLNEILAVLDDYERIYTNAPKDGPAVAAAAVSKLGTRVKHLPNEALIFSGEAYAVL